MEALTMRANPPERHLRLVENANGGIQLTPRLRAHLEQVLERGCLLAKDCRDCRAIQKAVHDAAA